MTIQPVQTWASTEAVEQWRQGAARRAQVLGPATDAMFDAAGLRPGIRVVDLAAGSGDQTIMAARRIGPSGSILAVDISPTMLAAAEQAIREAGLANVTTMVADLSDLDLEPESFDAAISRLGLMFLPEPELGLGRIRRGLKPDARLAALVWSSEQRNPYMGLMVGIVRDMGRLPDPPPTLVRAMSLSAPGRLERCFGAAGFRDVSVRAVAIARDFASVDETIELLRAGAPQIELLSALSDTQRNQAWAEVARRLQTFVKPGGHVRMPGELLLAVGTK